MLEFKANFRTHLFDPQGKKLMLRAKANWWPWTIKHLGSVLYMEQILENTKKKKEKEKYIFLH